MKTLISTLFMIFLFVLQGCIQAPSNTRKSTVSSATTSSGKTTTTATDPTFAADENTYWYTTTKNIGTVTVNKNIQDVIYLRGKLIHNFLNAKDTFGKENYRRQFCMLGTFGTDPSYKQLRLRAVPISITASTKATERLLRIDIASETDNTTSCSFSTQIHDSTINGGSVYNSTVTAFSLPKLCVASASNSCNGLITSTLLSLHYFDNYYYGTTLTPQLVKVNLNSLSLSSVSLRADLSSNSTDTGNSCTNSSCSAKGFDCCISGQCVNDATEKTNAKSDLQYPQASLEIKTNPLAFINYPNIYNICSNISHTPVSTTPVTTTPTSEAQARIYTYASDWKCISDYSTKGENTFYVLKSDHITFVDSLASLDASLYNTVACNQAYYNATKKKLSIACGCTASDSEMSVKCPDWGIIPVYKSGAIQSNSTITDFTCYTPAPANPIGPITNLNVSVPNRSAPHRFFTIAGANIDDLSGLQTTAPNTKQEGEDFNYTDEYNKAGPNNGSFNVNSVIGQMTVDLNHALPAKEVNVELGKTYILSATSGYFTPCSKCVKDSWFQTFTAHPTSQRGVGLQASGYSTSRDTYSGNSTFGNYEDTKFGRACYVPVTMLPLAHQKNPLLQTQRLNRLKTQAAFYINGYQRDWYGFNKGALIGSFDGVTWFAVGTGRRATATSTKLFLALNSSFLDLADKTDTIVNIIPDFSTNVAADYDYDPDISLTDPRQNTGATCQNFHQCSTDADCVAQLGWEYACTDVSQFKTKWPQFDSDGKETANQEKTGSLFEILQATISTSNGKRCTYRGQGAPCKRVYTSLTDVTKKGLTCAPNFYCASIGTNAFNNELARSPNELDNILFGMDANILGRPLNYVTANKTLDEDIKANIKYNAQSAFGLSSIESDDMGICRPGRMLSIDDLQAHGNADTGKRTDYISQIGSCNSALSGDTRFLTCPAFDDTLNYVVPDSAGVDIFRQTQNSCGGESKHISTNVSAFKNIEGLSLLNLQNIIQPILAQDACFRRAGSICHSDLDCGPNKMHEDAVGSLDIKYFGGTEGEQQYWRESLICGQGTATPTIGTTGYLDYKLNSNRCCREIGKDFTMVTQGPSSIVPENTGTNSTLITSQFAFKNPKAANRYSRYSISKAAISDNTTIPKVVANAEPAANQWRVINETGALTCCGGGFIRKFADGTHDWKVRNRLTIDANNFMCLNFRSPLADSTYSNQVADKVVPESYTREYELFCKSPGTGGCMQVPYQDSNGFSIVAPIIYDPSDKVASDPYLLAPASGNSRINTSPIGDPQIDASNWNKAVSADAPYAPIPYIYSPVPYDQRNNVSYTFFTDRGFDYGVEMYLPAYVGWDGTINNATFIQKVQIIYYYDAPTLPFVEDITSYVATAANCNDVIVSAGSNPTAPIDAIKLVNADTSNHAWCITKNSKTGNRPVVNVKADITGHAGAWKYAGIIIDFKPVEYARAIPLKTTVPGNALYYLSKLARMELIGVPQITYEPLYCNSDQSKLVPGIFKTTATTNTTRANFTAAGTYSMDTALMYNLEDWSNTSVESTPNIGNFEKRFTYQDKLDHPAVFSSKDFTCCTPLGKSTSAAAKCCSGFAVTSSDGKTSTCKLPKGTDLNVYFNKFISNEGVGDDQPGGGLISKGSDTEVDFVASTGEPKYRGSTYDKLVALGIAYCDGKKPATGGAFGAFPPEPFSGSYAAVPGASGSLEDSFPQSIVDSVLDYQNSDLNLGKVPFDSGFKWNHHYYCK